MAARFGANAAVVMLGSMRLTFISAELTCHYAGVKLRMHELIRGFRLSHEQPRCGGANVSTIQVGPDASTQFSQVIDLVQARVSARTANLRAQRQRVERIAIMA